VVLQGLLLRLRNATLRLVRQSLSSAARRILPEGVSRGMIDPVTAIAGATAAFNFMKKSISVGRDLQDMGQQLQQWAGCMAELDQAEKMAEKPPWYKALGGGTQAQAMEVFMARKKAQQMRDELRQIISHPAILGPSHWQEFLRIEAEIRKQKREHEFRRMEIKQTIIEWAAGVAIFFILVGAMVVFIWLARTAR
jgi:hypothetical protein